MLSVFQHFLAFQTLAKANRISSVPSLPSFQAVERLGLQPPAWVSVGRLGLWAGAKLTTWRTVPWEAPSLMNV